MRRSYLTRFLALAALLSAILATRASAQDAGAGGSGPRYSQLVLIEITETIAAQADDARVPAMQRPASGPCAYDSSRRVLRTPGLRVPDGVAVLHRIVVGHGAQRAEVWSIANSTELPDAFDLKASKASQSLGPRYDGARGVGRIALAWDPTVEQHIKVTCGETTVVLGAGQGWSPAPSHGVAAIGDAPPPTEVSARVEIRFWGQVRGCSVSETEEAEALAKALGGGYPTGRAAAFSLIAMGRKGVPALVRLLEGGTVAQKSMALSALQAMYARDAVPSIIPLLRSENVRLAQAAALTLGRLEDPRAADALVKAAGSDDAALSVKALGALGFIGKTETVPFLTEQLKAPDARKRVAAAAALGLMGRKDGLSVATELCRTGQEPRVLRDCAQALWAIGGPEAIEALRGMTKNGDRGTASEAALYAELLAARVLPPEEGRQLLMRMVREGNATVRMMACEELLRTGSRDAEQLLASHAATMESTGRASSAAFIRSQLSRSAIRRAWLEAQRDR